MTKGLPPRWGSSRQYCTKTWVAITWWQHLYPLVTRSNSRSGRSAWHSWVTTSGSILKRRQGENVHGCRTWTLLLLETPTKPQPPLFVQLSDPRRRLSLPARNLQLPHPPRQLLSWSYFWSFLCFFREQPTADRWMKAKNVYCLTCLASEITPLVYRIRV